MSNVTQKKKKIIEPWLSFIEHGIKTHEGRIRRGFWASLAVGDEFVLQDTAHETHQRRVRVTEIQNHSDFVKAWEVLGDRLIPGCRHHEFVEEIYCGFYTPQEIKKHGVVALGLSVL
jgi:ASC-1-like (ASCH) protein